MPAWITPLLCVLVSMPGRGCRSATHTVWPSAAMAAPAARPTTPPPITRTSMRSAREGLGVDEGMADYGSAHGHADVHVTHDEQRHHGIGSLAILWKRSRKSYRRCRSCRPSGMARDR